MATNPKYAPYGVIHVKYDDQRALETAPELMKRPDKIRLHFVGAAIGLSIFLFGFCGEWLITFIKGTPIMDYYATSDVLMYTVQIFYSIFTIVLPFALGGLIIKLIQPGTTIMPLGKPKSGQMLVLALGISFLTLVVSNFVTSMFVVSAESGGFAFDGGTENPPASVNEFFWQMLSTAVVPALAEEFAIRGVILQSLRKYGDKFAIIFSAFIFGIMHGNMVQAPFAFILGLVMGWLVVVTDSLWTGIAIHFMNNTYATVLTAVGTLVGETTYVVIIAAVNVIGALLGFLALIIFLRKYNWKIRLNEPGGDTPKAQRKYRGQAFLYGTASIPMIISLIYLGIEIAGTIHYVGV